MPLGIGSGGIDLPALVQRVIVDPSGAIAGAAQAEGRVAAMGASMASAGSSLTKGLTLPLAALGAAAIGSAMDVGKATTDIQRVTGITGDKLNELSNVMKMSAQTTGDSFGHMSEAVSAYSVRLNLTGMDLQQLTTYTGELTRMLGAQAPTIDQVTAVMNQFQITGAKTGSTLDEIYVVSQKTGVGMNDLMSLIQRSGPVMASAFHLTLEQTTELFGQLGQLGPAAAAKAVVAMTTFAKTAVKAGEDPQVAFKELVAKIQGASSETDKANIAFHAFGSRGGAIMLEAIKQNRVNWDAFTKELQTSQGAISKNADATESFGTKLEKLKNSAEVGLAPIGSIMLTGIKGILDDIIPLIQKFADWMQNLGPTGQKVVVAVMGIAAALGPALLIVGSMLQRFQQIVGVVTSIGSKIAGWVLPGGGSGSAAKGAETAGGSAGGATGPDALLQRIAVATERTADELAGKTPKAPGQDLAGKAAGGAASGAAGAAAGAAVGGSGIIGTIGGALEGITIGAAAAAAAVAAAVLAIVAGLVYVALHFEDFKRGLGMVWAEIKSIIGGVGSWFKGLWGGIVDWFKGIWHGIESGVGEVWSRIKGAFSTAASAIGGVVHTIGNVLGTVFHPLVTAWNAVFPILKVIGAVVATLLVAPFVAAQKVIEVVWHAIVAAVQWAWGIYKSVLGTWFDYLRTVFSVVWNGIRIVVETVWKAIVSAVSGAWNWLKTNVFDPIVSFIRGVFSATWNFLWHDVILPVWNGIKDAISGAWNWIRDNVLNPTISFIKGVFAAAWNFLWHDVIEPAWNGIKDAISGAWNWLKTNVFDPIMSFIGKGGPLQGAWNDFKSFLGDLWTGIKDAASSAWDQIKEIPHQAIQFIGGILGDFLGVVATVAEALNLPWASTLRQAEHDTHNWAAGGFFSGDRPIGMQAGGDLMQSVGGGFATNGPVAIVGEGNPNYPEYVIPTDPAYAQNRRVLLSMLLDDVGGYASGGKLGGAPMLAGGGLLDTAVHFIGDPLGTIVEAGGKVVEFVAGKTAEFVADHWPIIKLDGELFHDMFSQPWNLIREKVLELLGIEDKKALNPPPAGGAVSGPPSPQVTQWVSQGLSLAGRPQEWTSGMARLAMAESGGNPRAVNSVAVNGEHASGLMQMLPSTFRAHMVAGHGQIFDPVDNPASASNYIAGRYGSVYNTPLFTGKGPYQGYAGGGIMGRPWFDPRTGMPHADFSGGSSVSNFANSGAYSSETRTSGNTGNVGSGSGTGSMPSAMDIFNRASGGGMAPSRHRAGRGAGHGRGFVHGGGTHSGGGTIIGFGGDQQFFDSGEISRHVGSGGRGTFGNATHTTTSSGGGDTFFTGGNGRRGHRGRSGHPGGHGGQGTGGEPGAPGQDGSDGNISTGGGFDLNGFLDGILHGRGGGGSVTPGPVANPIMIPPLAGWDPNTFVLNPTKAPGYVFNPTPNMTRNSAGENWEVLQTLGLHPIATDAIKALSLDKAMTPEGTAAGLAQTQVVRDFLQGQLHNGKTAAEAVAAAFDQYGRLMAGMAGSVESSSGSVGGGGGTYHFPGDWNFVHGGTDWQDPQSVAAFQASLHDQLQAMIDQLIRNLRSGVHA